MSMTIQGSKKPRKYSATFGNGSGNELAFCCCHYLDKEFKVRKELKYKWVCTCGSGKQAYLPTRKRRIPAYGLSLPSQDQLLRIDCCRGHVNPILSCTANSVWQTTIPLREGKNKTQGKYILYIQGIFYKIWENTKPKKKNQSTAMHRYSNRNRASHEQRTRAWMTQRWIA